jgi:hypothetical protein
MDTLSSLLSFVSQAIIVIAIPFVASHIGALILQKMVHREFFQVPILTTLARLQGVLLGLLLVRLGFDHRYFDLEQMFQPDGPWNLTLSQFLLERANMFVYGSLPMMRMLGEVPSNEGLLAVLIMVVLPLLVVILSLSFWELREALQALFASAGIALWAGWLTVYLICMAFWTFHLLNFWSLILLVLYVEFLRRKEDSSGWWPW